jgi:hypothetical protein
MTGAVMIRWGSVIHGREDKSLEVFSTAINTFEQLSKQGRISGHREYINVTGHDGGFMLVEGDLPELLKLVGETTFLELNSKASAVIEDFEIEVCGGGSDQAIQELMGTYSGAMQSLGYMS